MARLWTGDPDFAAARGAKARAAAVGKALLFLLASGVLAVGITVLALIALHIDPQTLGRVAQTGALVPLLVVECAFALGALFATLGLAAAFREPAARFGWGVGQSARRRLRDLASGLACGGLLLTGLLAAIGALGGLSLGPLAETLPQALRFGGLHLLAFGLVALAEEAAFRGYVLVQLSRAAGFWPAAVILALLFGLAHAGNAGESPVGLVSAGAIGLALAYSFLRSGSLLWALGFHAAWDYAQSFVWGVPDSGVVAPGALFHAALHGPVWLTGGRVGPEASWLVLPVIVLVFLIVRFTLARPAPLGR